jgi:hypothetical protein
MIMRAVLGVVLLLAGLSILCGLFVIGNCVSNACESIMFGLGLTGTALMSCFAQVIMLFGAYLLCSALHRRGAR